MESIKSTNSSFNDFISRPQTQVSNTFAVQPQKYSKQSTTKQDRDSVEISDTQNTKSKKSFFQKKWVQITAATLAVGAGALLIIKGKNPKVKSEVPPADNEKIAALQEEIKDLSKVVKAKRDELIKTDLIKDLTKDGAEAALSDDPKTVFEALGVSALSRRFNSQEQIKSHLVELMDIPEVKTLRGIRRKVQKDPRNHDEYINEDLTKVTDFIYTTMAHQHKSYDNPKLFKQRYGMSVEDATNFIIENQDNSAKEIKSKLYTHFKKYNDEVAKPFSENPDPKVAAEDIPDEINLYIHSMKDIDILDIKDANDNEIAVTRAKIKSLIPQNAEMQDDVYKHASQSKEEATKNIAEDYEKYMNYAKGDLAEKLSEFEPYNQLLEKTEALKNLK